MTTISKQIATCFCSILIVIVSTSCEEFLDAELPKSKVPKDLVFSSDVTATSAVTGIYVDMASVSGNFANGSYQSSVALTGLSSDELINYSQTPEFVEFEQNVLSEQNQNLLNLWSSAYNCIYQANGVLEGLSSSTGVTAATKNQLEGESLFIRALSYFYLVNLFGDIPLITTTDYRENSQATRTSKSEVYDQIVKDLITAQELLSLDYIKNDPFGPTERVRPNKATATALLSRVYLYLEDWVNAEMQASSIIDNVAMYNLPDLNSVFLKESSEAIWQLRPVIPNLNTQEGFSFIITGSPQHHVLSNNLLNAFESGDNRQVSWIGNIDTGIEIVHFPFKYKVRESATLLEYSTVFRLAEQYLIRAEARAHLNKLSESISDVDIIRNRAGLPLIQDTRPDINKADLLLVIEHERQVELFTEWGHRWFDLKRTNRVDVVLDPIKPEWNSEDSLYPIPRSEFSKNQKLGTQNPGY